MKVWKITLTFGSGAYKLHLDHSTPKDKSSLKSRTLATIFTNKTSFSPSSQDKSSEIEKSWKIPWAWDLGSINYISATWAQKTYLAISEENFQKQDLIFSKTIANLTKLWNLKKGYDLGVWGLEIKFGPLGPKTCIKP